MMRGLKLAPPQEVARKDRRLLDPLYPPSPSSPWCPHPLIRNEVEEWEHLIDGETRTCWLPAKFCWR